jgi:maleylacetate reductase
LTIPGFDLAGWDQPIRFGIDRVHELGAELERLGRLRPLVVCSWRRRRSEEFRHLAGGLGMTPQVFQGVEQHVPAKVVEAAWEMAQEHQADAVISFGGGSTIDLGKSVAFVAQHGLEALDSGDHLPTTDKPALVHVAVPTTYSGAEATGCFFVSYGQEKRRLQGAGVRADLVVADPSLTLTLPWKPTAGTGLTALAHCVEALYSPARREWTDSLALGAAGTLFRLLPAVASNPKRVRERADVLAAAYGSGVISDAASTGLHGALCNGLGGRTGIPHGVAAAILLPHVMRFNLEADHEGLVRFARAIGATGPAEGVDAVEGLVVDLGLPRTLREAGVFEQDLEPVAAWAAEQSPEAANNPRPVSADDALAVLRSAW